MSCLPHELQECTTIHGEAGVGLRSESSTSVLSALLDSTYV